MIFEMLIIVPTVLFLSVVATIRHMYFQNYISIEWNPNKDSPRLLTALPPDFLVIFERNRVLLMFIIKFFKTNSVSNPVD